MHKFAFTTVVQTARLFSIFSLFLCCACIYGENASILKTKSQIKQLDHQIHTLQQTLHHATDKRGLLNHELAGTEKQIGAAIWQLHRIQNDMKNKKFQATQLQQQVNLLNQQLQAQQHLLAQHVRTRYKMGEYQPLKMVLNQDEPYRLSRVLTFYRYLVQSREQIIDSITKTKQQLTLNKNKLNYQVRDRQQLEHQLADQQQKLQHNKNYHTTLIRSLNRDILSKQHTLQEYKHNKDNLSRLLKTLALQSTQLAKHPFSQMRKKLPHPVRHAAGFPQKMNQGVTFFAGEGTPVLAVYPGKVVFSDWLRGYGLLLILDHGQGFMTLYAHNQSLFKHKGQIVSQNEQIAAVGHSGGLRQSALYFEIRQRGRAVPPLGWLS